MNSRNARLAISSSVFCILLSVALLAQTPTPAPTLPPGMVGSNTSDPRANLSAGLYDAGEKALGMRLLQSIRVFATRRSIS